TAFAAHTSGGWRAAGRSGGVLKPGAQATYAIWDAEELTPSVVRSPFPKLTADGSLPRCLRTVRCGRTIFDYGSLSTKGAP
ncbi:MAG: amidohydrolase, partial [Sciscionella sp.]|nr:amidohydrolase [Sciscionella sp.]